MATTAFTGWSPGDAVTDEFGAHTGAGPDEALTTGAARATH